MWLPPLAKGTNATKRAAFRAEIAVKRLAYSVESHYSWAL